MSHELTTLPRVGLALAGGVMEGGFYEVGVLCALEEAVGDLEEIFLRTTKGLVQ